MITWPSTRVNFAKTGYSGAGAEMRFELITPDDTVYMPFRPPCCTEKESRAIPPDCLNTGGAISAPSGLPGTGVRVPDAAGSAGASSPVGTPPLGAAAELSLPEGEGG